MSEAIVIPVARPPAPAHAESVESWMPLALRVELQTSSALVTVLTVAVGLGCRVAYVKAIEGQGTVGLLAPVQIMHRIQGRIAQIIEVLAVSVTPWPADALRATASCGGAGFPTG
jgi:hypothetical protein